MSCLTALKQSSNVQYSLFGPHLSIGHVYISGKLSSSRFQPYEKTLLCILHAKPRFCTGVVEMGLHGGGGKARARVRSGSRGTPLALVAKSVQKYAVLRVPAAGRREADPAATFGRPWLLHHRVQFKCMREVSSICAPMATAARGDSHPTIVT